MWRGSTTACSMKTVGSPKAASASRMQVSTASRRSLGSSTLRMPRPPPPATAFTNSGYGSPRRRPPRPAASTSVDGRHRGQRRDAGRLGGRDRAGLVAGQRQHVGGRADEGDAGVGAGLGQRGVLREEAVAGVDRVRAGPHRGRDDRLGVEVGAHRVAALADLVGLVGLQPVLGPAVLVREHRDRPRAELVGGTERPDRDLAAVGHEHLGEHGSEAIGVGGVRARRVHATETSPVVRRGTARPARGRPAREVTPTASGTSSTVTALAAAGGGGDQRTPARRGAGTRSSGSSSRSRRRWPARAGAGSGCPTAHEVPVAQRVPERRGRSAASATRRAAPAPATASSQYDASPSRPARRRRRPPRARAPAPG